MTLYAASLPLPPVTKKNHQRVLFNSKKNVHFIAPSVEYTRYEREACRLLPPVRQPIGEPVNVRCLFFMGTHRRVDLTNLLESIDDILVKKGILLDDHCGILVSHDGSRVMYDKQRPRTEILITGIEGEEKE